MIVEEVCPKLVSTCFNKVKSFCLIWRFSSFTSIQYDFVLHFKSAIPRNQMTLFTESSHFSIGHPVFSVLQKWYTGNTLTTPFCVYVGYMTCLVLSSEVFQFLCTVQCPALCLAPSIRIL